MFGTAVVSEVVVDRRKKIKVSKLLVYINKCLKLDIGLQYPKKGAEIKG
jgi:hypothetical protein